MMPSDAQAVTGRALAKRLAVTTMSNSAAPDMGFAGRRVNPRFNKSVDQPLVKIEFVIYLAKTVTDQEKS
jgi:hypothetical protein